VVQRRTVLSALKPLWTKAICGDTCSNAESAGNFISTSSTKIDWVGGEDPQYVTYIPVETEAEIEVLRKCTPSDLCLHFPRLQKDFPKGAKEPTVRWVGK
jgi:hypothetical protein